MPKRKLKPLPDREMLVSLLSYDTETGGFVWKERPASMFPSPPKAISWNKNFADKPAFLVRHGSGYLCGYIFYDRVYAHRVAWKIITGEEPPQIDHINGDRSDNRFANLRAASNRVNSQNSRRRSDNTSGVTGVSWDALVEKWHAYITVNGAVVNLGRFKTVEEARAARKAAERMYDFNPNHGRT